MSIFVSFPFISSFIFFTLLPCILASSKRCQNFSCGSFPDLNYPFGINGSGCGDPDFQLVDCNSNQGFYMSFDFNDDAVFRLKNLSVTNAEYGVVRLEVTLNTTNCTVPLHQLVSSRKLTYGSSYDLSVQDTNTSQYFLCDENPGVSSGLACGFHWFPLSLGKSFCDDVLVHTITLPTPTVNNTRISDGFIKSTGLLVDAIIQTERRKQCLACLTSSASNSCGFDGHYNFQCFCGSEVCKESHDSHHISVTGEIGAIGAGLLLVGILGTVLIRSATKEKRSLNLNSFLTSSCISQPKTKGEENGGVSVGSVPIFSFEELRTATNSFSDKKKLGEGGYGSVYHGRLKDGREVAVKKLYDHQTSKVVDQFLKEAQVYSTLLHPNVVRLYGCTSPNSQELLLVFEYVPNGTLADHLHGGRQGSNGGLSLLTRLKIALQTAEALFFLHKNDPPIFHRDVKSLNILLDEHMDAKVADFGLCRPVPLNATHVTTCPQGSPGYVDPEYFQYYQLTDKSDVYSFGVVLVEIISGKLAVDVNRNKNDINLASMAVTKIQEGAVDALIDSALMPLEKKDKAVLSSVAELAFRCLASQRDDRPTMKEVAEILRNLHGKRVNSKDSKKCRLDPMIWSPIRGHEKWPYNFTE